MALIKQILGKSWSFFFTVLKYKLNITLYIDKKNIKKC